jgi:hypothetical protein
MARGPFEQAENVPQVHSVVLIDRCESASLMTQTAVSKLLIGPYGLHAFAAVVLGLFLAFLWLFNFTSFF